ncbi:heavy metal translocating P-type ATPase [Fervidobacterium gondwanense]|uniref:heavy metal translocating P-type ATPase n=1 Tax=Fervidobacterium gondwanense TaxID=44754 RepID=UPI0039392AB7
MEHVEKKKSLRITGMTCANCARIVEKSLSKVEGVKFAAVNLATNTAFVVLEDDVDDEILAKAVESVGYGVTDEPVEAIEEKRLKRIKTNLIIALIITIPLSILMLFHTNNVHIPYFKELELIFAALVIFYAGRDTIKGATIALLHKHSNMDTLILFGSVTAWLTTPLSYFMDIHAFGSIGAMIVSLHLLGRFIESYLRDRASKQVKELLALQSKDAQVITDKGEFTVPIEAIKEGHILLIKPGERIPTDGEIIEGTALVDESMITGEPIPVEKGQGDSVIGGSLNVNGVIKARVTKTGEDTFLSKMISLVQEAQGAKVPIQQLADRITNYFVPTIVALALISAFLWYFNFENMNMLTHSIRDILPWTIHTENILSLSIFVFLTTVVIACPCALGLATPMALIVGTSLAAKRGLLIRNAEAIQTVKNVGYVLFDKTGTITEGKPKVSVAQIEDSLKPIAYSLMSLSTHPLSRAVAEYLSNHKATVVQIIEFTEIHGKGVQGNVDGVTYFLGKPKDIASYSIYTSQGKSIVEFRKDDEILGFFVIEDAIREDSVRAITELKNSGIIPVMVTGDNENTAKYVSNIVGIEQVYANVKPEEKLNIVRKFQAFGKKVIMVGDGINDAAALKAADIGIAIGSGSDLAIDSADIIITKGGISKVADVIKISKITFQAIKVNLLFAFFYNVIAIPLAMLGLLHPAIAEAAMAMSSITVIFNSIRIRNKFERATHLSI